MADERMETAGGGVARGFVAGDDEQCEIGQEFERRKRLTVYAAIGQGARKIVARGFAPVFAELVEVLEKFQARALEVLFDRLVATVFRVRRTDHRIAEPEHHRPVGARNAKHLRDHRQRKFRRDLRYEVAFLAPHQIVKHLGRNPFYLVLQLLNRAWREALIDHPAGLTMWGRVHVEELAEKCLIGKRRTWRFLSYDKHLSTPEQLGRARDRHDVGVF